MEITLCCLINIYDFEKETSGDRASIFFAVSFFVIQIVTLSFAIAIINLKRTKLTNPDFKARFGSLYEGLRLDSFWSFNFTMLNILRKLILAFSYVVLKDFLVLQLLVGINSSFFMLIYLIKVKPFIHQKTLKMELLNETCILLIQYYLLFLSDSRIQDTDRSFIGYLLIATGVANFLANFIVGSIEPF